MTSHLCFNSTLVQLKGKKTVKLLTAEQSFNSTLVQLKVLTVSFFYLVL